MPTPAASKQTPRMDRRTTLRMLLASAIAPQRVPGPASVTRRLDAAFRLVEGSSKHGALLVLHRGELVYERYFGAATRDSTPNLASVGKPFTAIAIGILLEEKRELFPEGLNQKIFTTRYLPAEAFPLSDPAKADIRLGHLLTMTAGIRGNNPGYVRGERVKLDPEGPDGWEAMVDEMALGKRGGARNAVTLWCKPGEGYSYATCSPHIASIMLRHVSGMELQEYIRLKLAEPLGWGKWGYGYRRPQITHTPGGGGIELRAADVLRFGQLLLHGGRWGGRQIVPAEFVRHCGRLSPYNPHYPYSLQFEVNSGAHWNDVPRDAFWKTGSGGHCLYIVPSLDLVVWKLGGRDDQYGLPPGGRAVPPVANYREVLSAVIKALKPA